MKKLLTLLITITGISAISAEDKDKVTFDIWNKTLAPLYFEVSKTKPTGQNLILLNAFGEDDSNIVNRAFRAVVYGAVKTLNLKVQGDYAQIAGEQINTPTYVLLTHKSELSRGDEATLLTIAAGKDVFIRIKPDGNGKQIFPEDSTKYLVGPQTGPLFGWLGRTERWLPLADNVKKEDIAIDTKYVIGSGVKAKPISKKPSDEKEKPEIVDVMLDISDTPNVLDNILENFNSNGDYIGFGEFTQDDADAYADVLSASKDSMDTESVAHYEAWLESVKKAVGNKGITKETKQLHDTLADVLKDDEVTDDEQDEIAEIYQETGLTGDQATTDEFKGTLDQILSGFDEDGNYIGYTDMEGNFANMPFEERHLRNFDNNLLLLKAGDPAATDDIEFYEGWRDFLLDAIGKMPQGQESADEDSNTQ